MGKRGKKREMKEDYKEHFKMYKAGKRWVFAGIATFLGVFLPRTVAHVHADTVQTTAQATKTLDSKQVLATQQSTNIPADSTTANSQSGSLSTSTSTSESTSTSVSESTIHFDE